MEEKRCVNREYKDRLFRLVFREKKDLLELYNAVNGTDYQDPEELEITTLEDAVFLGMKNDISFLIGETMNLYEHQSTRSRNLPLRGLLYIASLYQNYVEKQDCSPYRSGRISLPFPNCLVFYNGEEDAPEEEELLLSEAFRTEGDCPLPGVECRVRVLNINRGHNRGLMEKCRRLWEYAEFIGMLRDNLKAGMGTAEAIDAAIKSSLEQGILTDILTRCKTEVYGMLLTEYDEKKVMEDLRREAAEIAVEEERRKSEEERKRYKALLAEKEAENEAAFRKIMILQRRLDELAGAGKGQGD